MSNRVASREDILIAIIEAAGHRGLDRLQLQKSMFLVGEEFNGKLPTNFYQFRPHSYGPFAPAVYSDVERLCDGPLVNVAYDSRNRPRYSLGPSVKSNLPRLSEELASSVKDIVDWVTSMSFDELVRAIYYLYPEQRKNSQFDYSEELAMEEHFQRAFQEIKTGKGRPALELADELRTGTVLE